MGLLDTLRAVKEASFPERPIQIVALEKRRLAPPRLHFLVFTGDESPWQPPRKTYVDATQVPRGVTPQPGQTYMARTTNDSRNGWRILWDQPDPPLPPMQFPNIAGGQDPNVMMEHLRYLASTGALPQEGLESGEAYLRNGGWFT